MALRNTQLLAFVFILIFFAIPKNNYADNKEVEIAINGNYFPYEYVEEGMYGGFNVDLINSILENYDFSVRFLQTDLIKLDSADVILFGVKSYVPEGYVFIPIGHKINYMVYLPNSSKLESLNDLYKKKVMVVKNDIPFNFLYANKSAQIFTVKSVDKAIDLLSTGINDCAILPFYVAQNYIKERGFNTLTYITTPFQTEEAGFYVKKTRTDLVNTISFRIKEIQQNDRYDILLKTWFKDEVATKNEIGFWNVFIVIILLLIIVGPLLMIIHVLSDDIRSSVKVITDKPVANKNKYIEVDLENDLIQKLLTLSEATVFVNDDAGNIILSSKEFIQEFKTNNLDIGQININNLFSEEVSKVFKDLDTRLIEGGNRLDAIEIDMGKTVEEPVRWMLKMPFKFKDDKNLYILTLLAKKQFVGVNTLKKMSSEERLAAIINSLPDMVFYKNIDGEYIDVNRAFMNFSGKEKNELLGKTDTELFSKETANKYIKSDLVVFKEQTVWEEEVWDRASNGEDIFLKNIKIPIFDKLQRLYGLVGISYDITQRYRTEQALANAKEKAEESDRVKSAFLANMSQEIRTPVNSIIGFTDLLADPDLTYDQRIEIIDMIQTNGHNLIDVIDDIIDIAKIEGGQVKLKFSEFDLNSVIKDAHTYITTKKLQINKDLLNVGVNFGSLEDEFYIHGEPFRLKQVFKNLLNYGIRNFSTEVLHFGYVVHKDRIVFYVKNENSPITFAQIDTVVKNTRSSVIALAEVEGASEIAIMIASNVIKMINGNLLWEREKDKYSSFYFSIPFIKAEAEERVVPKASMPTLPDWTGKTLLVAEDEETNFILINSLLSKTKANIIRAVNGEEAINIYTQNQDKIDLILMDIRMPKVNGAEASRKILHLNPNAIIIAQTAYVMAEDRDLYMKIGMKEILAKPIDPSELYYSIGRYLKK